MTLHHRRRVLYTYLMSHLGIMDYFFCIPLRLACCTAAHKSATTTVPPPVAVVVVAVVESIVAVVVTHKSATIPNPHKLSLFSSLYII